MKNLLPTLSLSLLFYSASSYAIDEGVDLEVSLSEENPLEEVAVLEPMLLTPQPLSKELDFTSSMLPVKTKSAFIAVGLSSLAPGLGHAYLGDFATAGSLFGGWSSSIAAEVALHRSKVWKGDLGDFSRYFCGSLLQSYGVYSAYRDVRSYNNQEGYVYSMPKEGFSELALAPFQWSVVKKPEVWGGFLGALAVGAGMQYFLASQGMECSLSSILDAPFPPLAFLVGISEESLFRGFLQPALSEFLTPWGGIISSSFAFGAMHIPNAKDMHPIDRKNYYRYSLPFITAFSFYFGWMSYKNCSLKECVALHAWYDFSLFLGSYLVSKSLVLGEPSFSISVPF